MSTGDIIRGRLRPLAILLACTLLLTLAAAATVGRPAAAQEQAPAAAATRPNIILILTDDMRLDELRFMPAVRSLVGDRGVTFTKARSNNPLCCPARATLLTGKLSHNNRVFGNRAGETGGYRLFRRYNSLKNTLGVWLQRQGYHTGFLGKYLNEYSPDHHGGQPGWTRFAVPRDAMYNYQRNRFWFNGKRIGKDGYRETYQRRLLMDMLDRWGARSRTAPYFIWYNSLAPHSRLGPDVKGWAPPLPEKKYAGTVGNRAFTPRPSVTENVSDKPRYVRYRASTHRKGFSWAEARGRAMALKSVNDTVRQAVAKVRAQGELGNTVFIFSSDNGFMLGEHELTGKAVAYEESTRIPLLIAGPGFARKVKVRKSVGLVDVVPTILRAAREPAEVTARHDLDGAALQRVAGESAFLSGRPTLLEGEAHSLKLSGGRRYPVDGIGRAYSGVAWGNGVLVTYNTGEREFYRLDRDPWQRNNVFDRDAAPTSLQGRLERWLADRKNCRTDGCRAAVPGS